MIMKLVDNEFVNHCAKSAKVKIAPGIWGYPEKILQKQKREWERIARKHEECVIKAKGQVVVFEIEISRTRRVIAGTLHEDP